MLMLPFSPGIEYKSFQVSHKMLTASYSDTLVLDNGQTIDFTYVLPDFTSIRKRSHEGLRGGGADYQDPDISWHMRESHGYNLSLYQVIQIVSMALQRRTEIEY